MGKYLNPIARLGEIKYSYLFPLITTLICYALSEIYANMIARNPMVAGMYVIFMSVGLIIYFSFRDGVRGGIITSVITIGYYLYIIYTRNYTGQQLTSGLITSTILGAIFLSLSVIIGYLKQTIDKLIEREADARRRLEAIIEQLPIGVIITNESGKLVHQNKKTEAILGMKLPSQFSFKDPPLLLGKSNTIEKVDPEDVPILDVLASKKPIIDKEYVIYRKNGTKSFLQVSASVIRNRKGKVIAATEIINDITSQKELEQLKDEFISIASHELKTPITTIKGFTEIMLKQAEKEKKATFSNYLSKMNYQIDRTTVLVNELLDVSRIQSGKLDLKKESINFSIFVKEIVDDLQQILPTHSIILQNDINGVMVSIDKYRLNQVISNLITNAVKYSPQSDNVLVNLTKKGDKVIFTIKDYGIGISKRDLDLIFDRFYQAKTQNRPSASGLGLGLYIATEIIKRHSGRIWAESSKGNGSTFSFEIPIKEK
jgi:two-component system, OmpR family, phosphate regulon sensor histidine kinase PhoR